MDTGDVGIVVIVDEMVDDVVKEEVEAVVVVDAVVDDDLVAVVVGTNVPFLVMRFNVVVLVVNAVLAS